MELGKKEKDIHHIDDLYHIDPEFDKTQHQIWTADMALGITPWLVRFLPVGTCFFNDLFNCYFRAVRSDNR